ncbi:hypothetical protein FA15DRAFT_711263 [Coprinopsis marcescibilis]|uniref:lytic cellulose monooxygenase (C4-dehydrogenating) n=1 Tax=Coprinopsis marcescibilis TaxID=230819 RepID=A0A5C3KA66_COPMA|nr:hypothetical protein FA15DRAFT_711263 [Coprinopsis marcescibilis]
MLSSAITWPALIANDAQIKTAVRQPRNDIPVDGDRLINDNVMRCSKDPQPASETVNVRAGSVVGFTANPIIFYGGPTAMYLGKVPSGFTASTWDGSGTNWFKIAHWGVVTEPWFDWVTLRGRNVTTTIPTNTPTGEYLLRVEHASMEQHQRPKFLISCAQIRVTNGGSGNPTPKVAIPGHLKVTEPGFTYNSAGPLLPYQIPGPTPWKG